MKSKYMNKYMMAAAAAAILAGWAGETPVADTLPAATFKNVQHSPAIIYNPTAEQAEASQAAIRKMEQEIRNKLIWKNNFAQAKKELDAIISSKDLLPDVRIKAILYRIECDMRAKDYAAVIEDAEKAISFVRFFDCRKDYLAILAQKAAAQNRLKQYDAKAETLFERLSLLEDNEKNKGEIFNTKREIIRAYESAGKRTAAIQLAEELAESPDGREKEIALAQLGYLYRADGKLEQAVGVLKELEKLQGESGTVASFRRNIARTYAEQKKPAQAAAQYKECISHADATPEMKVQAFCDYAWFVKNWKAKAEYPELQKIAAEKIFSIKDLKPDLYGRTAAAMITHCREVLKNQPLAAQYAESMLAYPKMPIQHNLSAIKFLSAQEAEKGNYIKAEKMVLDLFSDADCKGNVLVDTCKLYAQLLTWQEKCDEAVKFLRSKITPANKAALDKLIADTYVSFYRYDDAAAVWKDAGDLAKMVAVYKTYDTPKAKAMAEKILRDGSKDERLRGGMLQYFLTTDPKDVAVRKEFAPLMKYVNPSGAIRDAVSAGAWDQVLDLFKVVKENGYTVDHELAKCMVQTYASSGMYDELVKFTETEKVFAPDNANSRLKPEERVTYRLAAETLKNVQNQKGAFKAYFAKWSAPVNMTEKAKADMLLKVAALALSAKRDVLAQDIYDTYTALFKAEPCKTYNVAFTDTPLVGMRDFLQLKKAPEKQLMDRKYGGNMDFLVTDVATGNRGAVGSDANAKQQPTEMQIVCDERGVHFLFTAYDSKALDAEAGLAGMGSYEMYLAPGENQPYICILPDLSTGQTTSIWNSSYRTAQWRPVKPAVGQTDILTEQQFSESGYQLYMRVAWEKFYDKLPENGKVWDFENIHWSRFGGSTWNGLKTIHGRSTWGKLKFGISEDQMLKIKKRIIFAARKAYLKEKATNGRYHGAIDRLQNDAHLGDPEFYNACAAKIIEKLDSYLPLVKTDMDDAAVNKVFNEAVPGWFEITFILSDLHRKYLEQQLMQGNW